jgi:predicted Zn-dependent protease
MKRLSPRLRVLSLGLLGICLLAPLAFSGLPQLRHSREVSKQGVYMYGAPRYRGFHRDNRYYGPSYPSNRGYSPGYVVEEVIPFSQDALPPMMAPAPRYRQQQRYPQALSRFTPPVVPPLSRGGDYFAEISAEGAFRWARSSLPLKVYITNGAGVQGFRPEMRQILIQAFDEWAQASQGKIAWQLVNDLHQADIACTFRGSPRSSDEGVEGGRTATTIVTDRYGREYIESAQMELLTRLHGVSIDASEFRKAALHEVGHALGLQGHSSTSTDIMYFAVAKSQSPYLQSRDINTLMKLYSSYPPQFSIGSVPSRIPRS